MSTKDVSGGVIGQWYVFPSNLLQTKHFLRTPRTKFLPLTIQNPCLSSVCVFQPNMLVTFVLFFTMSYASLCLSFSKIGVLLSQGNGACWILSSHLNKFSLSTLTFNCHLRSFNLLSSNVFYFIPMIFSLKQLRSVQEGF